MAVKSSKEKKKTGADEKAPDKPERKASSSSSKQAAVEVKIINPAAPAEGECNAAFVYKGKTYQVSIKDRVVILPKFESDAKRIEYVNILLANGFLEEGKPNSTPTKQPLKIFTVAYPDREPDVDIKDFVYQSHQKDDKGKPIKVLFKRGVGKTTYPGVVKEMVDKGYLYIKEELVEDDTGEKK